MSIVDTINATSGSTVFHPTVFKRHGVPMKEKDVENTWKLPEDLTPMELKVVKDQATAATKDAVAEEYLAYLFLLLLDDKMYGPLKTQLDNMCFDWEVGVPRGRPSSQ
jgi:hypothetical protein